MNKDISRTSEMNFALYDEAVWQWKLNDSRRAIRTVNRHATETTKWRRTLYSRLLHNIYRYLCVKQAAFSLHHTSHDSLNGEWKKALPIRKVTEICRNSEKRTQKFHTRNVFRYRASDNSETKNEVIKKSVINGSGISDSLERALIAGSTTNVAKR